MDAPVLDLLLRGVAIGAQAAMAAGLARAPSQAVRVAGILFCVEISAYVLNSAPVPMYVFGVAAPLIHFFAFGGVGALWLFIVTLFEDRKISWATLGPWLLLTGLGIIYQPIPRPTVETLWVMHNLIEAGFAVHGLHIIARSWRGDLVEGRRRLRGPFMAAVAVYSLLLSAVEIGEIFGIYAAWYSFASAVAICVFSFGGALAFLSPRTEIFGAASAPTPAADKLPLVDRAALDKLEARMTDGAWRQEGLTIGSLAESIGVPEHRLRRLINDHLDHRNFAAFINARRIEAAKTALTDPAQAQKSVSSIAYDLGFGSLGPFNRAFKEATGLTPTEFRKRG
ncbi:helix-turn-helix domain-containing protein [Terricaulis sp.]|uniref:helix-turn-helix domain-containing protein n=1 Tax=Terricaulis sp. TaxID=2768686 RepID=UPI003783081E